MRTGAIVTGSLLFAGLLAIAAKKPIESGLDTAMKYILSDSQKAFLDQLHPAYRDKFKAFVAEVQDKLGWNVIITSGYRTFQKQVQLYAENPSNAKPGKSMHNYGLAIDVNLQKGATVVKKASPLADWEKTGVPTLARNKYGLTWGGDFKTYHDPVHFGMDHKLSMDAIYAAAIKQFGDVQKVVGNQVKLP